MTDQHPTDHTQRINYLEKVIALIENSERTQTQRFETVFAEVQNELKYVRERTEEELAQQRNQTSEMLEFFRGGTHNKGLYQELSEQTVLTRQNAERLSEVLLVIKALAEKSEDHAQQLVRLDHEVSTVKDQLEGEIERFEERIDLKLVPLTKQVEELAGKVKTLEEARIKSLEKEAEGIHGKWKGLVEFLKSNATSVLKIGAMVLLAGLSALGLNVGHLRDVVNSLITGGNAAGGH